MVKASERRPTIAQPSARNALSLAAPISAAVSNPTIASAGMFFWRYAFPSRRVQTREARVPETAEFLSPFGDVLERSRFEAAGSPLRLPATGDESSSLEHSEVLGDPRAAHGEWSRKLFDGRRAGGETSEDRASRGVGQSGESRAECVGCRMHITIWLPNYLIIYDRSPHLSIHLSGQRRPATADSDGPAMNPPCVARPSGDGRATRCAGPFCWTSVLFNVPRPLWYRALIAVWGLWFTAALSNAAGLHTCPTHGSHAAHASLGGAAASPSHDGMGMAGMDHGTAVDEAVASTSSGPQDTQPSQNACTCLGSCCCAPSVAPLAPAPEAFVVTYIDVRPAEYPETSKPRVERAYAHPFANGPPAQA